MTLHQLSRLKRWHVAHQLQSPIEYHTWDVVLTLWVMGWMGLPSALLLGQSWALLACAALLFAPGLYCGLRRLLHTRGALRCEWLASASLHQTPRTKRGD